MRSQRLVPALSALLVVAVGGCSPSAEEPQPQTAALFDLELAGGFFDFPWPSDARLLDSGSPDVSTFPLIQPGDTVDLYLQSIPSMVQGFGTNPLMHVRFDGALDPYGWPAPMGTVGPESPVQLINVDPASLQYLTRTPLQLHWQATDRVYVPRNTLSAVPAVGFPLAPDTTYALVVLDGLLDAAGLPLVVDERLQDALAGDGEPVLRDSYALLGPALDLAGVAREHVAVATVFTTSDSTAELRAMRDWVADPANLEAPDMQSYIEYDPGEGPYDFVGGTYSTPVFQRGDPPYTSSGGGFEFIDGEPLVQRWESVAFTLTVPRADPPAGGFPVVISLPGTGGTIFDHTQTLTARPLAELLTEPERSVAVFSFEPPLHGSRGEDVGAQPDLHTLNHFNPESYRCVIRQEALDTTYALRFLREELAVDYPDFHLDTDRVGLLGHGQGGHAGALLAAVEPEIDPVWLDAAGGGQALTAISRAEPLDVEQMLRGAIGEDDEPLTVFHPFMGLLQLLTEEVDPVNYAPLWALGAAEGEGTSVLLSGGFLDPHTPYTTISNLAVAGGAPPIEPVEWGIPEAAWAGLESAALPLSGNVEAPDGEALTSGLITRGNLGHYVMYECYYTAVTGADFLATGLADEVPTAR
jgi:hypothetical protein